MAASDRCGLPSVPALALLLALLPPFAVALDKGPMLMREGRFKEAEALYAERASQNASDAEARLNLGISRLRLGDFGGADTAFSEAIAANPTFAEAVARAWKAEGARAIRDGKPERALALYAKALLIVPSEAPELGGELLEAANAIRDENERARLVSRAARWTGADAAVKRSAEYYKRKLGQPRTTSLDETGWAKIGKLKTGDRLYYLSPEPIRQKDAASLRILPVAVEIPLRLTVEEKDTKGTGETEILLGRHEKPAKVYFWLMPGGD